MSGSTRLLKVPRHCLPDVGFQVWHSTETLDTFLRIVSQNRHVRFEIVDLSINLSLIWGLTEPGTRAILPLVSSRHADWDVCMSVVSMFSDWRALMMLMCGVDGLVGWCCELFLFLSCRD